MRRLLALTLLTLLSASTTGAQQKSEPGPTPDRRSLIWQPNHPGWDQVLVDGVWFRTVYDADGIGVQAAVGKVGRYSAAVVTVFNHSLSRIEVRPELAYLYELKPKERRFSEIAEKYDGAIVNQRLVTSDAVARAASALVGAASSG